MCIYLHPEVITITRLKLISLQTEEVQDEYLDRIEIIKMNRESIDILKANIRTVKRNNLQQMNFQATVQDLIQSREAQLERDLKKLV